METKSVSIVTYRAGLWGTPCNYIGEAENALSLNLSASPRLARCCAAQSRSRSAIVRRNVLFQLVQAAEGMVLDIPHAFELSFRKPAARKRVVGVIQPRDNSDQAFVHKDEAPVRLAGRRDFDRLEVDPMGHLLNGDNPPQNRRRLSDLSSPEFQASSDLVRSGPGLSNHAASC